MKLMNNALTCAVAAFASTANAQEIKIWTLVQEGMPEFLAEATASFEVAHPGVTVVAESFPVEAYKTQIQVALTGSTPPDVFFNWSGEDSARVIRGGLAVDITEFGSVEGGFAGSVSEGWLSSFAVDGKNFGVPIDAVSKYFYFDPEFFADNALSVPATFDEFLGTCRAIREIDASIVPWPLGNSERWKLNHVITMINQRVLAAETLAADYALTAGDDALFTDAGYVAAWDKVVDLQEAGCLQDAPNATSPAASRSMFAAQVSPMIFCGTWCGNIFRFPAIEGGAGDPGGQFLVPQGYMVSSKSENPDIAAAFISHLVSDEQARSYADYVGAIPSNPTLIDEVEGNRWFKFFASDVATATESVNVIDVLLHASVANAYLDAGVEVLNGTMTAEDAMVAIRTAALEAKAN